MWPVVQGDLLNLTNHRYLLQYMSSNLDLHVYLSGGGSKGEDLELSADNMLEDRGPSDFKSLSSRPMYL